MCGIVGIVDPRLSPQSMREKLGRMNDAIVHRGPDDQGTAMSAGLGIGMRRLSIIDLSGGHQPIANEAGDIHVVCNGEIYNHHSLRQQLAQQGHRFSTGSDTEVIVHLYEQHGDQFVQHLRGMFALAILDTRKNRLLFARDRLGKKPLFYAMHEGSLLFGSEMKSLLAVVPELCEPDYQFLTEYLQFGFINQPHTIYRSIKRLPAGSLAISGPQGLEIRPYWEVRFRGDESVGEGEWLEQLQASLLEAVSVRLESEVPLGVFLSGGLDSSGVVSLCHQAGLHPLKTFTVGFDRKEWDESEDAALVARHFQTEHHVLRLSEQSLRNSFAETLTAVVHHCDEPFGDASAIPTYHISRLAREHVTVILSGDGGDELFAGYSAYRGALFAQRYRRLLPDKVGGSLLPSSIDLLSRLLPQAMRYKASRISKVLRDSSLPFVEAYREKTSIWQRSQLHDLLQPEMLALGNLSEEQFLRDDLWQIFTGNHDLVERLTEVDVKSYMLDDILVKVDRMSMAHSLEVRSPLLDHHVVELAARIPTSLKVRGGTGKYILRKALQANLPERTLRKGKQGFSVPLRDWFRGDLKNFVHDYLGPGGYLPAELFNLSAVQRILDQHQQGAVDHANRIWLLLSFAEWHRQYQLGESVSSGRTAQQGGVPCESS